MAQDEEMQGVYAVFVDNSEEFQFALREACGLAGRHHAHVMLVYALEPLDFQQWGTVEERLVAEQRRDAEELLLDVACRVADLSGEMPSIYVGEGCAEDVLNEAVSGNDQIHAIVFGASKSGSNPLVAHFSGKSLSELNVPLFIVPAHI